MRITGCGATRNKFLLFSLLFAGLTFSSVVSSGCAKNAAAVAPTKFVQYEDFDKAFSCSAPDGWKRTQAGGGGMNSSVTFANGTTRIDVLSDLEGSLMADISRGPGTMPELPPGMKLSPEMEASMKEASRPPVEKLHIARKGKVGDSLTNYKEEPMKTINSGMGEGRCSEWTGNASFMGGGDVHGYRATLLSGERRIRFVCRCPKSDWKTLQPAFDKVLASLAPATGGR